MYPLESCPDEPVPLERLPIELRTRHTGIYPREIAHCLEKRKTYVGQARRTGVATLRTLKSSVPV